MLCKRFIDWKKGVREIEGKVAPARVRHPSQGVGPANPVTLLPDQLIGSVVCVF